MTFRLTREIHSHSIAEILDLLRTNSAVFQDVKRRTESLHGVPLSCETKFITDRWESDSLSIFTEDSENKTFDFDSDIQASRVYKRVQSSIRKSRRSHRRHSARLPLKINLLEEEDLIDLRDHPPLIAPYSAELEAELSPTGNTQNLFLEIDKQSLECGHLRNNDIAAANSDLLPPSQSQSTQDCKVDVAGLHRSPNSQTSEKQAHSVDSVQAEAVPDFSNQLDGVSATSASQDSATPLISTPISRFGLGFRQGNKEEVPLVVAEMAPTVEKEVVKRKPTRAVFFSDDLPETDSCMAAAAISLPPNPSDFVQAASSGQSERVRCRLQQGDHIHQTDLHVALFLASMSGHEEIVQMLLLRGLNINCMFSVEIMIRNKCHKYFTPLHIAAAFDQSSIIEQLLKCGAKVSSKDNLIWTPLHLASVRGCASAVQVLLAHQASKEAKALLSPEAVNATQCSKGNNRATYSKGVLGGLSWTPLFVAAHFGILKTVQVLLESGANVHAEQASGFTLLHVAALGDSWYSFLSPDHAKFDTKPQDFLRQIELLPGCSPHSLDYMVLTEFLIECGANAMTADTFGHIPLHLACLHSVDTARVLIRHTRNVSVRSNSGWTPLHIAALWSSGVQLAQLLIEAGADLEAPLILPRAFNAQKIVGRSSVQCLTPLGLAVAKGNYAMVVYLLSIGAMAQMPDANRANVVTIAAVTGHTPMLTLLCSQGVGFRPKGLGGGEIYELPANELTSRQISQRRSQRDQGPRLAVPFPSQINEDYFATEECLPRKLRVDVDTYDRQGNTPLLRAIQEIDDASVRNPVITRLLDLGANPTVPDSNGNFPLHFSERLEKDEIRRLFRAGADIDAKDVYGSTPLLQMVRSSGNSTKIEYMVALGANIYAEDHLRESASRILSERGISKRHLSTLSAINS